MSDGVDRFQRIEKSGTAYGDVEVYKAKDKETGEFVSLKRIRLEAEDEGIPSTTLREIAVLRLLKHTNIVELNDVIHSEGQIYLVFEYVERDLKRFYQASGPTPLEPALVKSFLYQILSGVDHCHSRGVMHRDLKPQNIFVSRDGRLKISDFGLARSFVPPVIRPFTHEVVTLWYRAPEILLGCKIYALPIDIWSIGVVLAEMVTKTPLLPGDSEVDELFKIFRVLGTPSEETWPGVTHLPDWSPNFPIWPTLALRKIVPGLSADGVDLLQAMLTMDPSRRPGSVWCLQHRYFDEEA